MIVFNDSLVKWPQLTDEMLIKLESDEFQMIHTALQTAHQIFKRYRYEFKSQQLWEEIRFVLDKFANALTNLLVEAINLVKIYSNQESRLREIYGSLVLIAKVFYSLKVQYLPDVFETNIAVWMNAFHELLVTDIIFLQTHVRNFISKIESF